MKFMGRTSYVAVLASAGFAVLNPGVMDLASATHAQTPARQPTKLVMLGTGTPVADPERSGPAVAIVVNDEVYLIDAGPGVVRRAAAAAVKHRLFALAAENLDRVFITHLHSDHTLGLPDLIFSPWVLGRRRPLAIYGPPGIDQMAGHLHAAWAEDIRIRAGSENLPDRDALLVAHDVKPGRIYDDGTVRVDAIAVAHGQWRHAFGYRFQTPGRTIVISGDARPTPALAEACNKCDILVHEVYSKRFLVGRGPSGQRYHATFHTSPAELAELANKAQPALLVLYHQLLAGATDVEMEGEVRAAGYRGRLVSAKDLDVF
jgi:ribonuclease BN (tRNA processing enzyme)